MLVDDLIAGFLCTSLVDQRTHAVMMSWLNQNDVATSFMTLSLRHVSAGMWWSPVRWETSLLKKIETWRRHQMETFSALLAICAGNASVTGEFPAQKPVTRSFDALFDLRLNKRLSKQSWGWWFETPPRSLWHHCNDRKQKFPGISAVCWNHLRLVAKHLCLIFVIIYK